MMPDQRRIARARVRQVDRVNDQADPLGQLRAELAAALHQVAKITEENTTLRAENERLERENDRLNAARLTRRAVGTGPALSTENTPASGGRAYLSQTEAARYLSQIAGREIKQYQIHRWLHAGHFQTVQLPGKSALHLVADSLYLPPPGRAGRKKGASSTPKKRP